MYIDGKACWLNHLDAAMETYNNRVHSTTKMTPFEMTTSFGNDNTLFQVGDFVRVPDKHNFYSKGKTTN